MIEGKPLMKVVRHCRMRSSKQCGNGCAGMIILAAIVFFSFVGYMNYQRMVTRNAPNNSNTPDYQRGFDEGKADGRSVADKTGTPANESAMSAIMDAAMEKVKTNDERIRSKGHDFGEGWKAGVRAGMEERFRELMGHGSNQTTSAQTGNNISPGQKSPIAVTITTSPPGVKVRAKFSRLNETPVSIEGLSPVEVAVPQGYMGSIIVDSLGYKFVNQCVEIGTPPSVKPQFGTEVTSGPINIVLAKMDNPLVLSPSDLESHDLRRLGDLVYDAPGGATFVFKPGRYPLQDGFLIRRSINFVGAGLDRTILTFGSSRYCISVEGRLNYDKPVEFSASRIGFVHRGDRSAGTDIIVAEEAALNIVDCSLSGAKSGYSSQPLERASGDGCGLTLHDTTGRVERVDATNCEYAVRARGKTPEVLQVKGNALY